MNIISADFKKGTARLRVTDQEDLWYLSHLIEPGDLVTGQTSRKMKIGSSEHANVARKLMTLTISAEAISLDENGTSLRVNGKIKEGPDDVPLDSYHALELEEGTEFTVQKQQWRAHQKQKLKEAAAPRYRYLFCLLDREDALLALSKRKGYEILARLHGDVPKKAMHTDGAQDFYQDIVKALEMYAARYAPEKVIVASPIFYKDDFMKKVQAQELKRKIVLAACSDVNETALEEVIRQPGLRSVLQESRERQETVLVDELLREISNNDKAAYGFKEVQKAVQAGAVKILIITDSYIQRHTSEGTYQQIDVLMGQVDALKGELHIISSSSKPGKRVDGLGGIAALLRYKWNVF